MERLNIMFASKANCDKWLYDRSNWEQTRKDLNMMDAINYFEKGSKDFPVEYLYKPCMCQDDAEYRLEIMHELLSNVTLFQSLSDFCLIMRRFRTLFRDYKEDKHEIQKQYRFLLLFGEFMAIASHLKIILANAQSQGLKDAGDFCSKIIDSETIQSGYSIASELLCEIGGILKNAGISINPYEKTVTVIDCEESGETGLLKDEIFDVYGIKIRNSFSIVDPMPLSYLEEKVLYVLMDKDDNMEIFENMKILCGEYADKVMDDIKTFIELLPQFVFYVSYIEFVTLVGQFGIPACKPIFDENGFTASDCAGITLILKFIMESQPLENIIRNDIRLPKSGMFILSGPNQGGKTIYLKALGLSAYLAKCGCYVFCKECRIPFYDNILTHFMQKEVLGKSRLVEEIERIEKIAEEFNRDSLVLLNESFTSTRRKDSLEIAMHYINKFDKIGCSVGFVSHFYEIPETYNNGKNDIISLRSGIAGDGVRTYKISEQKSDGLAYARDIAKNCGMTYEQLTDDIQNINNINKIKNTAEVK